MSHLLNKLPKPNFQVSPIGAPPATRDNLKPQDFVVDTLNLTQVETQVEPFSIFVKLPSQEAAKPATDRVWDAVKKYSFSTAGTVILVGAIKIKDSGVIQNAAQSTSSAIHGAFDYVSRKVEAARNYMTGN